jgi:hypothetical protein
MMEDPIDRTFRMNKRQFLGAAAVAGAFPLAGQAAPSLPGRRPDPADSHRRHRPQQPRPLRSGAGPDDAQAHSVTYARRGHSTTPPAACRRRRSARPWNTTASRTRCAARCCWTCWRAPAPRLNDKTVLVLRAVDGYNVELPVAQARARRFIVATHMDGKPMPLGGLGRYGPCTTPTGCRRWRALPLGSVCACPWALYHVEVRG